MLIRLNPSGEKSGSMLNDGVGNMNQVLIEGQRQCQKCQAFLPFKPDSSLPYEDSDENYRVVASGTYELRTCRKCGYCNIHNNEHIK